MKRPLDNGEAAGTASKRFADGFLLDVEFQKEIKDLTLKKLSDGARLSQSIPSSCRMCMDKAADGSCFNCYRPLCRLCIRECEQCDNRVCHFCYVVDYSQRWESRKCLTCQSDTK